MAKTFAKIAKTFAGLLTTIIATRRRPILILHLEAKYAKIDCKNEIYAKKLGKEHLDCKSQLWQKVNGQSQPSVKVNDQSQRWSTVKSTSWSTMTSVDVVADDVADDVSS